MLVYGILEPHIGERGYHGSEMTPSRGIISQCHHSGERRGVSTPCEGILHRLLFCTRRGVSTPCEGILHRLLFCTRRGVSTPCEGILHRLLFCTRRAYATPLARDRFIINVHQSSAAPPPAPGGPPEMD